MISADFGTVAFAPQYVRQSLTPYLRQLEGDKEVFLNSNEFFTFPNNEEKFCFNFHLCRRNLNELLQAEPTVAFYDGADEELVFRYDGQAAVAFADGQCALISPNEARQLVDLYPT